MSPTIIRRIPAGAEVQPDGSTHFRVWAPDARRVTLVLEGPDGTSEDVVVDADTGGYYAAHVAHARPGQRYRYRLDDMLLADPASRFQPDGPFGPSQVVDPASFAWTDTEWPGARLDGQIVSEIHVGTFTPEGTWPSAMAKLPRLAEIGITMIELMPVAEFPGRFGWGYDGVFPYAPTRLYGSPDDLRAFVDRAHALGLAVILDVVYNHLGPDGSVFGRYARQYFTNRFDNDWGEALNFDPVEAAPAREFWSSNAGYWIDEYHLDGLRLDATQSIHDDSDDHILRHVSMTARRAAGKRSIVIVAENERQDVRHLRPYDEGGFGMDALWNDDFHHSALVAATGRAEAYYSDHRGTPQEFISAAKYGFLFQGQHYAWQRQRRGTSTRDFPPASFVVFTENHDQVANTGVAGSRLCTLTSPGRARTLMALCLLMPGTPMLFQGQEFGATSPFLFFADHAGALADAVWTGRRTFMAQFPSIATPEGQAQIPAPHDPATFERCRLDWEEYERHEPWRRLVTDLLALRRREPAFRPARPGRVDGAVLGAEAFVLRYMADADREERLLLVNLGAELVAGSFAEPLVAPPAGYVWQMAWSSEAVAYGGTGTAPIEGEHSWRLPGHCAMVLCPEANDDGDGTDHKG